MFFNFMFARQAAVSVTDFIAELEASLARDFENMLQNDFSNVAASKSVVSISSNYRDDGK